MQIASYVERSRANGPGVRVVVWFQGCDQRCPGCCNPEFQPHDGDDAVDLSPDELAARVLRDMSASNVRGLTLSGGEPLHCKHYEELAEFLRILRRDFDGDFDVFVFSGKSDHDILADSNLDDVRQLIDMIIAGPFEVERENEHGVVSSLNQKIIRTSDRFNDITDDELINGERKIEVIIDDDTGKTMITGLSSIDKTLQLLGIQPPVLPM